MNRPKYLLDSYALLAYFQAEPAGAKVRNILKEAAAGAVEDVVNKKTQLLGIIDGWEEICASLELNMIRP